MKVSELIDILSALDPDAGVFMVDGMDLLDIHYYNGCVFLSDVRDNNRDERELNESFQLEEESFFPDDYAMAEDTF